MESFTLKVNDKEIITRLDVLYCLLQNVSEIDLVYKNGYYVLETYGGDGGIAV